MRLTAEEEMTDLIRACLPELEQIEAAFIQECYLQEPTVPLADFSKEWRLSAKALNEVRKRALLRLKELMSKQNINSLADIV
jgi:hypothetical protein